MDIWFRYKGVHIDQHEASKFLWSWLLKSPSWRITPEQASQITRRTCARWAAALSNQMLSCLLVSVRRPKRRRSCPRKRGGRRRCSPPKTTSTSCWLEWNWLTAGGEVARTRLLWDYYNWYTDTSPALIFHYILYIDYMFYLCKFLRRQDVCSTLVPRPVSPIFSRDGVWGVLVIYAELLCRQQL